MIGINRGNFGLSSNALKIIAAVSMFIDHLGFVLFPSIGLFRIIGRLAFPIFAFMIAEGCFYTKNKLKYFLKVFVLGVVCQLVYYLYDGSLYMGILITFSLSILVIYALQFMKNALFGSKVSLVKKLASILIFLASLASVYFFNKAFIVDYGFFGCLTAVFPALLRKPKGISSAIWEKIDCNFLQVVAMFIGLFVVALIYGGNQYYSFLALPLLLLYSGKRGNLNLKYFFYIFYPVHLLVIEGIALLIG